MTKNISIEQEKSRSKAYMNILIICLMIGVSFWVLSGLCLGIVDAVLHLNSSYNLGKLEYDWLKFFYCPWYVFEMYHSWWALLTKSFRLMQFYFILFVPFIVPFGMVLSGFAALVSHGYSFNLWYVLNHHFAKQKDIEKMGLSKGLFMVLGRFGKTLLSVKPSESVLCVGEMGTGKTSSVAIPSVLRSDNASIIAVDMTGLLPKYTAGHRSRLGKIFYYNWDLLDEPDKAIFYPRWNPLADENIPRDQGERDAYLKRIAQYIANNGDLKNENYWNVLTHSLISAFFGYWVAKVSQAFANDYFLNKLVEGRHFTKEEKDILLSYYILMPPSLSRDAIALLEQGKLTADTYVPIGSWAGIPEQWVGKQVCFASVTDWLIVNYLTMQDNQGIKDWQGWIISLLRESLLFGYGNLAVSGLNKFLALSAKQRQIVFACVLKPFQIFINQPLRERTNGNDFNLDDIRGIYDEKSHEWKPITVYSMANTQSSKILNQMFLDEAMYRSLYLREKQGPLPEILVLDDVGHNLKLKNLTALLETGKGKKISALLLCNSLSLVENTYTREDLERIVVNTSYKVIKAPDNFQLSKQLDKLATFATKSVQIPKKKSRKNKKNKLFADSNYFHRLALDFRLKKDVTVDTKNYQIVLAEGYYNCPILANNIYFAEDDRFKQLAVLDAEYSLSEEKLKNKDPKDFNTPKFSEVFRQKDVEIEDVIELDQYMNTVFDEVLVEIEEDRKDKTKILEKKEERKEDNIDDWWLDEGAFNMNEKATENPFNSKK